VGSWLLNLAAILPLYNFYHMGIVVFKPDEIDARWLIRDVNAGRRQTRVIADDCLSIQVVNG
jgi:hypothetical protein